MAEVALPTPVTFRLLREDITAMNRMVAASGGRYRGWAIGAALAVAVVYLWGELFGPSVASHLGLIAFGVAWAFLIPAIRRRQVDRQVGNTVMAGKDVIVAFLADKLVDRTDDLHIEIGWSRDQAGGGNPPPPVPLPDGEAIRDPAAARLRVR